MTELNVVVNQAALQSLQKALRKVDPALQKELRGELKAAATIVARDAQLRVPSRTGRASGSIRAGAIAKGAYVAGGKKSVPYYGWLDFGNRSPIKGRPRSVGPWKGSGKGPKKGRFIYPALDAKRSEVLRAVRDAVSKSLKGLGFG